MLNKSNWKELSPEEKVFQLAAIVSTSEDAIYSKTLDGIVTSWNQGAEKMYGYCEEEILGQPIKLIIPEDRIAEYEVVMERVRRGKPTKDLETVRKRKNGTLLNVSVHISPIKNKIGEIIGVSTIGRDITDKKRIEEKKNDFFRMAGHELKTPLTTIMLVGQMAERKAKKENLEGIAENIATINDQIRRMSKIVEDMLDLSKIEMNRFELTKEEVDIDSLVKSTVEDLQHFGADKKIYLEGKTGAKLWVDKFRIVRVLTNLIVNAIKYSGSSKTIKVILERSEGVIKICVQDYGIGISKEDQKKIFERDFRSDKAKQSAGGLGLGLFIAKEIIKSHKGKIWVESEPNVGSKFYFSLPVGA